MNVDSCFVQRELRVQEETAIKKKKANRFVLFRGLLLMIMIVCIVLAGYYHIQSATYSFLIVLVIFIFVVFQHQRIKAELHELANEQLILDKMKARVSNQWENFEDEGLDLSEDATYLDVDLIGHHSLYQRINVGKSYLGRSCLIHFFEHRDANRHLWIKEISKMPDFLVDFQCALVDLSLEKEKQHFQLKKGIERLLMPVEFNAKWLLILLPITWMSFIFDEWIFAVMMVVQLIVASLVNMRYRKYLDTSHVVYDKIHATFKVMDCLKDAGFQSEYLKSMKEECQNSYESIRQLDSILSMFNLVNNPIIYAIANGLLMVDVMTILRFAKWQKENAASLDVYFENMAQFEALCSCALIPYCGKTTCDVEWQVGDLCVEAVGCEHPLLNDAVASDFQLHQVNILTGSNMSGKSTFMRSVSLNLLCAMAGCEVFAKSFSCTPMRIITSMRLHDELSKGISSFYAEVLRIKEIMQQESKKEPLFVCIDEIFKGTNSQDRLAGARGAVKRLSQPHVLAIISTHDFELCEIEGVNNYHFDEHYEEDKIIFEYQLREGKCHSRNAIHLMKMAGILE